MEQKLNLAILSKFKKEIARENKKNYLKRSIFSSQN